MVRTAATSGSWGNVRRRGCRGCLASLGLEEMTWGSPDPGPALRNPGDRCLGPLGLQSGSLRSPRKSESLGAVLSLRLPCERAPAGAAPPNADRYHPASPIRPTRHL